MTAADFTALHQRLGISRAAIDRATDMHMRWTIRRTTEREHGIPAGLPYLTGWVQHFAIEAETFA